MRKQKETEKVFFSLTGQPKTLQTLITFYLHGDGRELLERVPAWNPPLFIGSGEMYAVARYAAQLCLRSGLRAGYMNVNEAENYPKGAFLDSALVVFFGSDLSENLSAKLANSFIVKCVDETSRSIQQGSRLFLPTFTVPESETASINSMCLAWLLANRITTSEKEEVWADLNEIRQRLQLMADSSRAYFDHCQELLKYSPRWVLVGDDFQQSILQFTSSQLVKRANMIVPCVSYEDYRENFSTLIDPDVAVIHFRHTGDLTFESELAAIEETGAVVIEVIDGFFWRFHQDKMASRIVDISLSPILNMAAGRMLSLSMILSPNN